MDVVKHGGELFVAQLVLPSKYQTVEEYVGCAFRTLLNVNEPILSPSCIISVFAGKPLTASIVSFIVIFKEKVMEVTGVTPAFHFQPVMCMLTGELRQRA